MRRRGRIGLEDSRGGRRGSPSASFDAERPAGRHISVTAFAALARLLFSMRLVLLLFALLVLLPQASPAQAPDAERLLYGWIDGQREAARAAAGPGPPVLAFTEHAERRFDGLRGGRTIETVSAMRWDGGALDRRVLRARVDGRALSPEAIARLEDRLDEAHGPELRLLRRAPILSSRFFAGFVPVGDAEAVERDGRTLWRVEARPAERRGEPARAALFFAAGRRDRPRLLHAEVEIVPPPPRGRRPRRGPAPDARILLEADFDRTPDGLDLARQQRVEAVVQQRRRLRTFSVAVYADLQFSDYQLRPRP